MKTQLTLQVSASAGLTDDELIEIVGQEEFSRIKSDKPGGVFKSWVLCHEGDATPRVIGKGQKKISWGAKAVQSAFNKLKNGFKFFNKHNADSSHVGREPFGEVVGKTTKIIDGKLSTIVIGHFDAGHKEVAEKSDVVSMEAFWNLIEDGKQLIADSVDSITAIALGESATEKPAFNGAQELATVQAFGATTVDEPQTQPKTRDLSFNELKELVRAKVGFPTQFFELSELIGKRVETKNGIEWIGGDREINNFIESKILKDTLGVIAEKDSRISELESAAKEATTKAARAEAGPRVLALLKEKQAPDRVIKMAEKNLSSLEIGDDIDASLNSFADAQIARDKELIELGYGVVEPPDSPNLGPKDDPGEKNIFLPENER